MARPEKNTVDYFPHPARHGKKMFAVESKFQNDGYTAWFKTLEEIGDTDFHFLNMADPVQAAYLAAQCKLSEERLMEILDYIVNLGAFDKKLWRDSKVIYSAKFVESVKDAYSKRTNKPLSYNEILTKISGVSAPETPRNRPIRGGNPQSKVKQSKVKETLSLESRPLPSGSLRESSADGFARFWEEYPRKEKKASALKAWEKTVKDWTILPSILKALAWQKETRQWKQEGGRFIPKPAAYLMDEQWKDEPPPKKAKKGLWGDA